MALEVVLRASNKMKFILFVKNPVLHMMVVFATDVVRIFIGLRIHRIHHNQNNV